MLSYSLDIARDSRLGPKGVGSGRVGVRAPGSLIEKSILAPLDFIYLLASYVAEGILLHPLHVH